MLHSDVTCVHPSRMECHTRPLFTKEERVVGLVAQPIGLTVVRMNRASLVFKNERGVEFYATRKIANRILAGMVGDSVLLVERTLVDENNNEFVQNWLALPSIF